MFNVFVCMYFAYAKISIPHLPFALTLYIIAERAFLIRASGSAIFGPVKTSNRLRDTGFDASSDTLVNIIMTPSERRIRNL
jgi:hypothetical protein